MDAAPSRRPGRNGPRGLLCTPVHLSLGVGGGPADRRSQRPASTLLPPGAERPSLPTGSWGGTSLESPVHTPHPVAVF